MDILLQVVGPAIGAIFVWLSGTFLNPYYSEYAKTKGKQLATHEDLKDILAQLKETTRAVEAVKAEVGLANWKRQQHWDVKRALYSQVLTGINDMQQAAVGV